MAHSPAGLSLPPSSSTPPPALLGILPALRSCVGSIRRWALPLGGSGDSPCLPQAHILTAALAQKHPTRAFPFQGLPTLTSSRKPPLMIPALSAVFLPELPGPQLLWACPGSVCLFSQAVAVFSFSRTWVFAPRVPWGHLLYQRSFSCEFWTHCLFPFCTHFVRKSLRVLGFTPLL